jgi:hypothetical protein
MAERKYAEDALERELRAEVIVLKSLTQCEAMRYGGL